MFLLNTLFQWLPGVFGSFRLECPVETQVDVDLSDRQPATKRSPTTTSWGVSCRLTSDHIPSINRSDRWLPIVPEMSKLKGHTTFKHFMISELKPLKVDWKYTWSLTSVINIGLLCIIIFLWIPGDVTRPCYDPKAVSRSEYFHTDLFCNLTKLIHNKFVPFNKGLYSQVESLYFWLKVPSEHKIRAIFQLNCT